LGAVALSGLMGIAAHPARGQSAVRVGSEFRVNAPYMTFLQKAEAVSSRDDGGFIVVWTNPYPTGVFARRYDSDGVLQAVEFKFDSATSYGFSPALATHDDGSFVVAWESWPYFPGQPDIIARRFDRDGTARGVEFLVNSYTSGHQEEPAIGMDGSGNFVIVWSSENEDGEYKVLGQRFDGFGTAQSSEFQVAALTSRLQSPAAVAMDEEGDFVVTWSALHQTNGKKAFGRLFDAVGGPQASEFEIDTSTAPNYWPSVAMHDDGDFVVIWSRRANVANRLFGRRFDAAAIPQATEFQISSRTSQSQYRAAAIAMKREGDFVVAWSSGGHVYGRRFDRLGHASTDDFRVEAFRLTHDQDIFPAAALDDEGRFVIAWTRLSYCHFPCHVQMGDVFAQRFASHAAPLDIDSDGSVAALTDGLLILRFLFDLDGPPLANGATSDSCARCEPSTIDAHLDALDTLDVDGDEILDPLTDGILILRYLFGFRGDALTTAAVGAGCVRCDAATIEPYLEDLVSTGG
jgi:hypothetical protein